MQETLFLYFDGLEHPVLLTGCNELTQHFPLLMPGWKFQPGQPCASPVISVRFDAGSYYISTSRESEVARYSDKVDLLCALVAELAVACSFHDLEALYLHAAAVEINGRLVVFPSQYRAGKSLLTACLVAKGHRYFGDDVFPLVLDSCRGRSAGFAPRLRLPLPATMDNMSKAFIENHIALRNTRYAYLALAQEVVVPRDELLNVGAFVLLEREEGADAVLEELPVASVFQQLIKQNFAREVDASRILSTLTQVVSGAQCTRLRYDRADKAVSLLTEHFSSWPRQQAPGRVGQVPTNVMAQSSQVVPEDCFMQNPLAQKIRIDGENFLASPDGKAIYHLNPVASGIWELLAEPVSAESIIITLVTAFPGVDQTVIEQDVKTILDGLWSKDLLSGQMHISQV